MPLTHSLRDSLLPLGARLTRRGRPTGANAPLLIVQPDHLGDILLSQPAVRRLRAAWPERRLVALVGPWSEDIARRAWPVDEVRTFAFPGFTRDAAANPLDPYRQLFAEARALAPLGASEAVVLRPDAWWAAWLARASVAGAVVGGDDARARRFLTRAATLDPAEHATQRACGIVDALLGGGPCPATPRADPIALPVDDAASDSARALLASHAVRGAYLVVHPGAGADVKLWPVHRWRALLDGLRAEGLSIVVTGSDAERGLAAELLDSLVGGVSLAGETPLDILIEVLRGATLVLGPDCGPLHLAVAVGTPSLHIFGPSDPLRYGPWGPAYNHHAVSAGWHCSRCGDLSPQRQAGCGCLLAVGVGQTLAAARRLLDGGHGPAR